MRKTKKNKQPSLAKNEYQSLMRLVNRNLTRIKQILARKEFKTDTTTNQQVKKSLIADQNYFLKFKNDLKEKAKLMEISSFQENLGVLKSEFGKESFVKQVAQTNNLSELIKNEEELKLIKSNLKAAEKTNS